MPEEKKPGDGIGAAKDIYLVTTVGLQIVISVLIGFGMGLWIDRWLGTKPWFMLLFILLGVGAGFLNVYRVVIQSGVSELNGRTKDDLASGKSPEDWDEEDS
ncbi:MAG: AtpZ/AtpI family protein [Nitrospinota bacterium]|nr:AtpZ/AtpI family protein [Nitrospinota bacterium]